MTALGLNLRPLRLGECQQDHVLDAPRVKHQYIVLRLKNKVSSMKYPALA